MARRRWARADAVFVCALAALAGLLLSRAAAGFPGSDEAFYLTVPLRLAQGDCLLTDEWHVTQLAGFLLWGPVELYLALTGGTDGIVLAFRYVYLSAQLLTVALGWRLLRRKSPGGSVAASLLFGLFVPFGIMALSYNSMGLMAVWLLVLMEMDDRKTRLRQMAMGVLLAAAVLCNPYMLTLYAVWAVRALAGLRRDGGRGLKDFAWRTAGAGVVLAAFAGTLLTRASVSEIMANLPYVLSDASHGAKGVYDLLRPVIVFCRFYPIYVALTAALFLAGLLLRKRRMWILIASAVVAVVSAWGFCLRETPYMGMNYGAVPAPLVPLGLMAFLFTERKDFRLLAGWLTGLLYAVCMILSSNVGLSSMQNALVIPACISVLMICGYLGERNSRPLRAGSAVLAAVWLAAMVWGNVCGVFNDGRPWTLTETIEAGPYKGTRTTPDKKEAHEAEYENILSMGDCGGKNVVFYSVCPYGYLMLDEANNAALSAWLDGPIRTLDDPNMSAYYELHPDKRPDMIYVDAASASVWEQARWQAYAEENGYALTGFDNGALLMSAE